MHNPDLHYIFLGVLLLLVFILIDRVNNLSEELTDIKTKVNSLFEHIDIEG